jgi:hypothetical protein
MAHFVSLVVSLNLRIIYYANLKASASVPLVPATISHKVNTQNNIHGKFPPLESLSRTIREVPAGLGGSFSKTLSPTPQASPHLLKLEKSQKKPAFTVSRNIPEPKEVTFENRYKTIYFFIRIFVINLYIW